MPNFSNETCVRGALEMVHLEVAAWFAQDNLKVVHDHDCAVERLTFHLQGDNVTELRVKFLRKIEDTVPAGDD